MDGFAGGGALAAAHLHFPGVEKAHGSRAGLAASLAFHYRRARKNREGSEEFFIQKTERLMSGIG